MDLSQVYSNISHRPVHSMSCAGRMPIFIRDEIFKNLENQVFSQISELIPPEPKPDHNTIKTSEIKPVSFEDALKELIQMKNNS